MYHNFILRQRNPREIRKVQNSVRKTIAKKFR